MKPLTLPCSIRASDGIAGSCAALISGLFSAVCSPTLWVLKSLLQPYLNLDPILAEGPSLHSVFVINTQLKSLGPQIVAQHILPALLIGLAVSIAYLALSAWVGQKAMRLVLNHFAKPQSA